MSNESPSPSARKIVAPNCGCERDRCSFADFPAPYLRVTYDKERNSLWVLQIWEDGSHSIDAFLDKTVDEIRKVLTNVV